MFTEPGQEVLVELAGYTDGEANDDDVPTGTTTEVLGDVDAFDVEDLGNGGLKVTSTGELGGIVIATRVPGQTLATFTEIYFAEPKAGVKVMGPDAIVFPPAKLPSSIEIDQYRDSVVTDDGPGPFSWVEVTDRVSLPEAYGVEDRVGLLDPGEATLPFVFRGPAPAAGTKLLSSASSDLAGEVVEPAGLPSIERDGFSLVTVRQAALIDLYERAKWEIDSDELIAAGVMPEMYSFDYSCPEEVAAEDCDDIDDVPVIETVAAPAPRMPGLKGLALPPTALSHLLQGRGPSVSTPPTSLRAARAPGGSPNNCTADFKALSAEFKITDFKNERSPIARGVFRIDAASPDWERIFLQVGFRQELALGASVAFQPVATIELECVVAKLGVKDIPIPLGLATGSVTFRIKGEGILKLTLSAEGGPSPEFKYKCSATTMFHVGFDAKKGPAGRFQDMKGLYRNETDKGCDGESSGGLGIGNLDLGGVATKFTFEAFAGLKVPLGLQAGGKLADYWALVFAESYEGKESPGFLDLAKLEVGPLFTTTRENTLRVLDKRKAETRSAFEWSGKFDLGSDAIGRIAKVAGLGETKLIEAISGGVSLWDSKVLLKSMYEPINVESGHTVDLWVDGEEDQSPLVLTAGEMLRVNSELKRPAEGPNPNIRSAALYVHKGPASYNKLGGVSLTASGMNVNGTFKVTKTICDDIGSDTVDVIIIADSAYPSLLNSDASAAAYGGTFQVKCLEPDLKFDREKISFRSDEDGFPATVNLEAALLGGEDWSIPQKPAWLEVNPSSGTFPMAEDETTVPVVLKVNCDASTAKTKLTADLKAKADNPDGGEAITAALKVMADCRDAYIEPNQTRFSAPWSGGTVTVGVKTEGSEHAWLEGPGTIPGHGLLSAGFSVTEIQIDVSPLKPVCRPSKVSRPYTFTTRPEQVGGEERGGFTITVVQAAPPKDRTKCKSPAYTWGDPHIVTFDGAAFGAQTSGEYWYVMPLEDGPDVQLQTRHELMSNNDPSHATIVTGAATRIDGHLFEWYTRSDVAPVTKVKIDGKTAVMPIGVPRQITDDLSIIATDERSWVVTSPEVMVEVEKSGTDLLNVFVHLDDGAQVAGVLGSPDGVAANDLVGRDGTVYSLGEVRKHETALVELMGSWRVTDLEDSLFSETYPGFDAVISRFNPLPVQAMRDFAADYLTGIDVICTVPTGDDYDYLIDSIAIEMAAGSPRSILSNALCSYRVNGKVTSTLADGSEVPVAGLHLTMTDDRLETCRTVTSLDGSFSCLLRPLTGDDLPESGTAPVNISIEGAWKQGGPTVLSSTATSESLASLKDPSLMIGHDLSIDPAQLVGVKMSGRLLANMTGDGIEPIISPTFAQLIAFDEDGETVGSFREQIVPDVDGFYEVSRYLAGNVTSVKLIFEIGPHNSDRPTFEFAVGQGSNPLEANVTFKPKLAVVSGTLVNGSNEPLGPTTISVKASDGAGKRIWEGPRVVTPDTTGAYRVVFVLPDDTNEYQARAEIGVAPSDHAVVTLGSLEPGVNPVTLSSVYNPPSIHLSGTFVNWDGTQLFPRSTVVSSYGETGSRLDSRRVSTTSNGVPGQYALDAVLPQGTVRATVSFNVGIVDADVATTTIEGIVVGRNDATFDYTYSPPRLSLSGVLLNGQGDARHATDIVIDTYGSGGNLLASLTVVADPTPFTGAYNIEDVVLPLDTKRATASYRIGPVEADWIEVEISPIEPGLNSRVYDIDERSTLLLVEGTALTKEDIPLGNTQFRVIAYEDGARLLTWETSMTPDSATGAYWFTKELPRATTRVEVFAKVGVVESEWILHEEADVRPGLVQAWFDFTYYPTWLDLSGVMTGLDMDLGIVGPMRNNQSIRVVAYGAGQSQLLSRTVTVAVNPVDGSYYIPIQLPSATESVRLTAYVGVVEAEWPTKTIDDIVQGTRNTATLDVSYVPTVLKVSGTIRLAGQPYAGQVRLTVTEHGDYGSRVRYLNAWADSEGSYETAAVLRLGATDAVVDMYPDTAPNNSVSRTIDTLTPGFVAVPISIDSDQTKVKVSGYLELLGQAQDGPYQVRMYSYDSDNNEIDPGGHLVTLNADGSDYGRYDETFDLDATTRSVRFVALVHDDDSGVTARIESKVIQITPGITRSATWNTQGAYVSVRATFTDDGVPRTEPVAVSVSLYEIEGSWRHSTQGADYTVFPDAQGEAELTYFAPLQYDVAGGSDNHRYEVEFQLTGDKDPVKHLVELVDRAGLYTSAKQIELSTEIREVIVYSAPSPTSEFKFSSYRLPSADGDASFEQLTSVTRVPGEMDDDPWVDNAYHFMVPVSPNATHLELYADWLDLYRMVEIPEEKNLPVVISPSYGATEMVIEGVSRVGPGSWCVENEPDELVAGKIEVYIEVEDPDNSGATYSYMLDDPTWVVPQPDGTFTVKFWLATESEPVVGVHVEFSSEGHGSGWYGVSPGFASADADLRDHDPSETVWLELFNETGCWMAV